METFIVINPRQRQGRSAKHNVPKIEIIKFDRNCGKLQISRNWSLSNTNILNFLRSLYNYVVILVLCNLITIRKRNCEGSLIQNYRKVDWCGRWFIFSSVQERTIEDLAILIRSRDEWQMDLYNKGIKNLAICLSRVLPRRDYPPSRIPLGKQWFL